MSMTVAVVADIHANLYAMQAFLAYLELAAITQVWNLGDFLQIGPHPAEVAELIFTDARFVSIRGNNELSLLQPSPTGYAVEEYAHQAWTRAQLGEDHLARLAQLSETRQLTICGKQVLLTHELPPTDAELQGCALVCCGHTHRPSYTTHGAVTMLNPGSLGFGWGRTAHAFSVLEISEAGMRVRHRTVSVDHAALKQEYQRRQVPDQAHIWSIFLPEGS